MIAKTKRSLWVGIVSIMALGVFVVLSAAMQQKAGAIDYVVDGKVRICHATNAVKNPYTSPTVDTSAADGIAGNSGQEPDHYDHKGPAATSEAVAQEYKDDKIDWGDIIPPIPPHHTGLNWTPEGQAVWNNNCNYPPVPEELAASASVTVLPATCKVGQKLVYGALTNATVKAGSTADNTTGPTNYTVTFVANEGATFEGDAKELVVQGSLTGALTEPRCETGQVLGGGSGGAGSTTGTPASLPNTSGEAGVVAAVAGSLLAIVAGFAGASRLLSRDL